MNHAQLTRFGARVAKARAKIFGGEKAKLVLITTGSPARRIPVVCAPPSIRDNAQLREAGFTKEVDAVVRVPRYQIPLDAGDPQKGWRLQVGEPGAHRLMMVDDIVDNPASPEWVLGLV